MNTQEQQLDMQLAATRFAVGAAQPAFRDRSNQEVRSAIFKAQSQNPAYALAFFMPHGDLLSFDNLRALSNSKALSRTGLRSFSTRYAGAGGLSCTALEALLDCPSLKASLRVSRSITCLTDSQIAYALWGSKDSALLACRMKRALHLGWLNEAALRALADRKDTHSNGSQVAALGALARLEASHIEHTLAGSTASAKKLRI